MNTREIKEIDKHIQEQFGCALALKGAFFKSPKNKIYFADKHVGDVDWTKLKVNSIGMYFGHLKYGFRLSIEGAQLIGKNAKKGVVVLDEQEKDDWMSGIDLDKDIKDKGFVLIKHGKDFLGCGKAVEGKILNYVPKIRRLLVK